MENDYRVEWELRLNPKRFRPSKASKVVKIPTGWNPFNSDYTRITMSAPFRRLQDKAQVFPLGTNDFVRTRLTHSIEVSSVARSLGVEIENWLLKNKYINEDSIGYISSILSTASLAHDIGNPPFGHFGETCIRNFFKTNIKHLEDLTPEEQADLTNFDGNVQGFRLLLRLGLASDEYSYNLTFPTLATVVKYPRDSITGNKGKEKSISFKKYGYYQTDKKKFCEISKFLGLSNSRHPLCFLLEAADDICYSVSDIEDGFKNKTISLHYLLRTLSENYAYDKECGQLFELLNEKIIEYKGVENKDLLIIQDCRVFVQIKMIHSAIAIFKKNHDDIMKGSFDEELLESSSSQQLKTFFQEIAVKNFNHESVIKSEIIGDTAISYLLKRLTSARLSKDCDNPKTINGKICTLLSHQSKYAMDNTNYKNKKYLKLLQVVDFVASMTDSYALSLYRELSGLK